MYCKNCGKQIDENSKFCQECGYDLLNFAPVKNNSSKPNLSKIMSIIAFVSSFITIAVYLIMNWINMEIVSYMIVALILSGISLVLTFLTVLPLFVPVNKACTVVGNIIGILTLVFISFVGMVASPIVLIFAFVSIILSVLALVFNLKKYSKKEKFTAISLIVYIILIIVLLVPTFFGFAMNNYRNAASDVVINGYTLKNYELEYIDSNGIIKNGLKGELKGDALASYKKEKNQLDGIPGIEYTSKYEGTADELLKAESLSVKDGTLTTYTVDYGDIFLDNEFLSKIFDVYKNIYGGDLVFSDREENSFTFDELKTTSFDEFTIVHCTTPSGSETVIHISIWLHMNGLCDITIFYIF